MEFGRSGEDLMYRGGWRESFSQVARGYYIVRPTQVNNAKLEKSRKIPGEKLEKRKLFRNTYDSTGPNDERYYVSNSSGFGTDASKAETDSSGREDDNNIFVRLLQNQVLNYNSKAGEKKDKKKKKRAPPPPSPTPDYLQPDKTHQKQDEKLYLSKSISSLLTDCKSGEKVKLEKKISGSSLELRHSPAIPDPDYEVERVRAGAVPRRSDGDVWRNADRYRGGEKRDDQQTNSAQRRNKDFLAPTETLKEVIKHRPPVAQVVKEITEESQRDKLRQRRRESMQRQAETDAAEADQEDDDEAQKIYREILDVVGSAPCGRGRMVGYGEEAQTTLRRGDRSNAARLGSGSRQGARHHTRLRLADDRASVTTSIDSYPFSPSSPWTHALPSRYNRYGYPVFPQKTFGLPSPSGPVSFAGFSSPSSQLTSSSLGAGPASLAPHPGRGKMKRKKKWFNIF